MEAPKRPEPLRGVDGSFTYTSIVKRLPAILRQMIQDNPKLPESAVAQLVKIENDILSEKGKLKNVRQCERNAGFQQTQR